MVNFTLNDLHLGNEHAVTYNDKVPEGEETVSDQVGEGRAGSWHVYVAAAQPASRRT